MLSINILLSKSNIHSIEYCGYYILKAYKNFELNDVKEINIEFNIGFTLQKDGNNAETSIIEAYSCDIINVEIIGENNQLSLLLNNGLKIISKEFSNNNLIDRNWIIEDSKNKKSLIVNDSGKLYISDEMDF